MGACNSLFPNRPTGDLQLELKPSSLSVAQGQSQTTTLTLTPKNGFTGTVALTLENQNGNAPSGITLSPTSLSVTGTSPVTQALTVAVAQSVQPGTYALRVKATSGSLTKTANLSLTVQAPPPPAPDFTISLNPTSLTVQQGGSGTTTLTLTPQNGFTGQVNLTLEGQDGSPAPSGITLSPNGLSVTGNGPVTQALTLSVDSSVATGTYPLRVKATAGNLSKTANLSLTVTAASQVNLRIAKAEWGQTVLKENLRLVSGKPALLRVHLLASPSPMSLSNPLAGAVYLGSTFQGNLAFTCPNPIPTATDPGSLATTCTATLPESWVASSLRVELRADPQDQVTESDEGDNLLTLTPNVGAGTVLYLTAVPVIHQGQQAQVPSFGQTLWRIWPLKEVSSTTRAPYTFSGTLSPSDANAWSQLLDELRILRQADGSGRYYYGFVKVSYTSGIAGIGYLRHPVAVGWDYPQSAPRVMAHELGHNFGREHAPCGVSGDPNYPYTDGKIGTWGYDLADGSLKDPGQLYDLMSYCGPQWISDYTYGGAQGFLEASPPKPQSLPEEGLLFSGRMAQGEVLFNPPLRIATSPEGEASPYRLRGTKPTGETLEAPVFVLRDSEGILHFQARLPLGPYGRVGLYLGSQLLKEAVGPLLPLAEPQVELREEGEFLVARVQGYPYFSLVHIAKDGTRTALGLWHRAGEVRFALRDLPPGGQWEIQLTDGLNVRVLSLPR
nr:M66 family metalloprotease [Thermus neutrinimicus]